MQRTVIHCLIFLGIIVASGENEEDGTLDSVELLINNNHKCFLPPVLVGARGSSLTSIDGSLDINSFLQFYIYI